MNDYFDLSYCSLISAFIFASLRIWALLQQSTLFMTLHMKTLVKVFRNHHWHVLFSFHHFCGDTCKEWMKRKHLSVYFARPIFLLPYGDIVPSHNQKSNYI